MAKKQKKSNPNTIAQNKRARFDYHISDTIEAGLELMGWEVKSLREGKGQLTDSYVFFKNGEAFLLNAQIQPLISASTHFVTEPTRSRRLLLHRKEITRLRQAAEQQGYTVIALSLYWKNHLVKCQIGLGKGKQQHDKRETEKQRDWNRQKQRLMQSQ
ncbi:SsrA-binding protein SmpB [Pseudoteredinibacter isoporae]|uniref:SsrA-binding protein n=1 Tax=Pseudoteredinibacter isoporae TaxID=570281 RepID=A0A7X0JRY6_9GAMM|nr:SsrA-binding protein SmpB [Pseudoteredinibacter isoporae]MBB6521187.1 SsrA-binding protein [Pseudoteredinibacter isoporae]NHO86747.1 SsrA-binding protein SmpB [Pseudoteredinibacter isoporae]NIB24801.1 SsrA-binding protein SmpB [Pseudoteredinibacter isoporae]